MAAEEKERLWQLELASGMVLPAPDYHTKVDDFTWMGNRCDNPTVVQLAPPKGVNWITEIDVARHKGGWAFGYFIKNGKKLVHEESCLTGVAVYQNRTLAISTAVTALRDHLKRVKAPPALIERIGIYEARLKTPADKKAHPATGLDKKGARK